MASKNLSVQLTEHPTDYSFLLEDGTRVTDEDLDRFIRSYDTYQMGDTTTVVLAQLRNGLQMVESSACLNDDDYDQDIGEKNCIKKIKDRIRFGLAFTLACANNKEMG